MKITIAGTPGSGKSTLAKGLAKEFDLRHFSVGDMRRQMAVDRGMDLAELNKVGETEEWTDKDVDKYVKNLGMERDTFIIEGRLAWHFIPNSIKVFLDCDETERAERILGRKSVGESYDAVHEVIEANKKRIKSDNKRYKKYYGVEAYNPKDFDVVVYSTGNEIEETLADGIKKVKEFIKHHKV